MRFLHGFTLFELVVVICILSVLMGVFLNRVGYYQEQAEKTAMVEVAGAIQSALVLQYGRMMVRGREAEVATLGAANPMELLAKKPGNYAGEFFDPAPAAVTPGNWAFDLKSRELRYYPRLTANFVPARTGEQWIRYRVKLAYDSIQEVSGKPSTELVGALFEPVQPYRWFD